MLIAIFGESCTGKTTLAERINAAAHGKIYSGKDYLRLAKSESEAVQLFQILLAGAVHGENVIYVITEREHLALLPGGAIRILVTAELDTIKERFSARTHGHLPAPVAAMLDTKGPEYRIRTFQSGKITLREGDRFAFTTEQIVGDEHRVAVSYAGLVQDLAVGDKILLNNGLLSFEVEELTATDAICRVLVGGETSNNKSMSFPNKVLNQVYLSEQDKADILFGIHNGVDYIACSFVSRREDLEDIQRFLDENGAGNIGLIAKIENQSGIDNIEDICAVIALYRPGPMDSIPKFLACAQDPAKVTYKDPSLVPILSGTYGCIVYQEQVIRIFQDLAGYSLGQADMVRRAMSKKKVKEIEKERESFLHGDPKRGIAGCVANGVPEAAAKAIYDEMYDFAEYAFNKSHSLVYAIVCYQTAWFKCHHPKEYMAALLTSVLDSTEKVAEYISECREMGIQLLPPDVNQSGADFTVVEVGIRFGLVALKGVGRAFITNLLAEREKHGLFADFMDFCDRLFDQDMNRRMIESLIKSGAFDAMGFRRSQLMKAYGQVLDGIAAARKRNVEGQLDLFGFGGGEEENFSLPALVLPNLPEYTPQELMNMEKETTGLYLSGHPMDQYRELAKSFGAVTIGSILSDFAREDGPREYRDDQRVSIAGVIATYRTRTTRNNTLMAYVMLEDDTATMELLCFSRTLNESGSFIRENSAILATGKISVRDDKEPQLMVDTIRPLSNLEETASGNQTLYLRLPSREDPRLRKVRLALSFFPGESQVVLYFEDCKKRVGSRCEIHPALIKDLTERLGEKNVVVK